MVQQKVLLSLDEGNLVSTAIEWIIQNILNPNDTLVLVACAHPALPPGKSNDGFVTIRRKEAALVKGRLEAIAQIVDKKLGKNIHISAEVGIWKIAQGDHIYEVYRECNPDKVFLFLDPEQQPWVSRTFHGTLSSQVSKRIPVAIVLTPNVLKRFKDQDIFGM